MTIWLTLRLVYWSASSAEQFLAEAHLPNLTHVELPDEEVTFEELRSKFIMASGQRRH